MKRRLPQKRLLCHSALGESHPPAARHFAEAPKDPAAGEANDSRSLALLLPSREQTSVRPSSSGFPRGPSPRILGKERRAAVQFGTSRCPARRRDRKGREGKEDEDEGSDDGPLAALGTTALAARMKGRVALLPREFYLTAAAKTGHRPCASLGGLCT